MRRERGLQLDDGALVAEVAPDDRVEAAVPEPLPWVGGGVGHAEPARAVGAPSVLEDLPGPGIDARGSGRRYAPLAVSTVALVSFRLGRSEEPPSALQ